MVVIINQQFLFSYIRLKYLSSLFFVFLLLRYQEWKLFWSVTIISRETIIVSLRKIFMRSMRLTYYTTLKIFPCWDESEMDIQYFLWHWSSKWCLLKNLCKPPMNNNKTLMNKNFLNELKFLNPLNSYTEKDRKKDFGNYIESTSRVYWLISAYVRPNGIQGSYLFRNEGLKITNKTRYELEFSNWFLVNFTYAKFHF